MSSKTPSLTFRTLFDADTGIRKILIPALQRSYAQGRATGGVARVRRHFLEALHRALENNTPLSLGLIYGDLGSDGVMTPVDGQQRLTTLFLLYCFAALKAGVPPCSREFLSGFSYEARTPAAEFCEELARYTCPEAAKNDAMPLSALIINAAWFRQTWRRNPTVSGMLIMLDAISGQFRDMCDATGNSLLWERLIAHDCPVTFDFMPLELAGQTDDVYIRINSRGRQLTPFEELKAELEARLDDAGLGELASDISRRFNATWTDRLWALLRQTGEQGSVQKGLLDQAFVRLFRFVCSVLAYEHGEHFSTDAEHGELLDQYFGPADRDTLEKNATLLKDFFDCWFSSETGYKDFAAEVNELLKSAGFGTVKSGLEERPVVLLTDCIAGKADDLELRERLLLYAITLFLKSLRKSSPREVSGAIPTPCGVAISETELNMFLGRLRVVRNLARHSIWDREIADGKKKNNMPALFAEVKIIMSSGIESVEKNTFNAFQFEEEKRKANYRREAGPEAVEILKRLEDNPLLQGQVSLVCGDPIADTAELIRRTGRFERLFGPSVPVDEEQLDLIDCALMCMGPYGRKWRSDRFRTGTKAPGKVTPIWWWFFHYGYYPEPARDSATGGDSHLSGYWDLSAVLNRLLKRIPELPDGKKPEEVRDATLKALGDVIKGFLGACVDNSWYPFAYYYVMYDAFRPGKYGLYGYDESLADAEKTDAEHYAIYAAQTREYWRFQSSCQPIPAAVGLLETEVSATISNKQFLGRHAQIGPYSVICADSEYRWWRNDAPEKVEVITISQCESTDTGYRVLEKAGIDTGDCQKPHRFVDTEDRVERLKKWLTENLTGSIVKQ